jgi:YidC/Oxa1 family membrane protein insertase
MMRMQKLAPEMERLKKKFGDDKDGLARAQADMYKEMGMSPVLGCLPTFLQMPIFIALWRSLQTTFELRQAPFLRWPGLPPLTWIKDLSEPDYLIHFSHPISLYVFGWHLSGINLLPLLMAVVTFLNQKYLMPPPAVQSAEQEQQRKMMTYMSLLFPLMFYSFPSGLSLYYLVSAGLGIIESKRIRAHIAKQEELERAGKEFVDAGKATRSSRQQKKLGTEKPAKKGFIASFLENMEARAEQLRRESEKRKKKGLP